jgi:hypothetical protein
MTLASTANALHHDRKSELTDGVADTAWSIHSAVSWGAVAAGAVAAASLSLILLILGVGLGLSSVSPWAGDGINATTFGASTIVWLTLTQLLASAVGGYLAGRLRNRRTGVHSDEVYFRDTAHGFLAWAVSALGTAALLGSVIGSIVSGGAQAGASVVGGAADTAGTAIAGAAVRMVQGHDAGPMGYFVDSLFRRDGVAGTAMAAPPVSSQGAEAHERAAEKTTAEVSRIFMNVSRSQPLPPQDIQYIGQIVAQRTGLSQADAEKRVNAVVAQAQAHPRAPGRACKPA